MLPSYSVTTAQNLAFEYLVNGSATEAFDTQAISGLEIGLADYWYPQYLATVVISIDRDKTDAQIKSWCDLPGAGEKVGIRTATMDYEMLTAAVAYGLGGDQLILKSTIDMFAALNAADRLVQNSFETPVVICYDYQAAAMVKSGKNIEIIIPSEGTLTYEKGLLSKTELSFSPGTESILLDTGFRLISGYCDATLYPDAAAYENSVKLTDYTHHSAFSEDSFRYFRRSVLHTRMYSSADGREHQLFVLIYIVIVVAWISSFIHRAMQKAVRRAAFFTGLILLGWIMVRLIKYQISPISTMSRYLWYIYYLFQLTLPLVILRLAWVIGKTDGVATPKWMRLWAAINAVLFALVMTNDLHNLVFRMDLSNQYWSNDYDYGIVYYIVLAFCFLPIVFTIGIMINKGRRGLRKKRIVFPVALFALLVAYTIGYATRFPLAWESDFTMVIGLFTLLFMETTIRAGMIPVNSKYTALFRNSPLGMQIIDSAGETAWSSASAVQYSADDIMQACASYPVPAQLDENTLLFAASITGGYVLWQEDVTDLNRLHKEIEDSVSNLEAANAILAEEEAVKRAIHTENNKTALMTDLETEITNYTILLSTMLEQLDSTVDRNKTAARIIILLCYIKRRCNLFFRERETEKLSPEELLVYFTEMAEIAAYSDVNLIVTCTLDSNLSVRHATLLYDFFYNVVFWVSCLDSANIPAQLGAEDGNIVLRLLLSEDARSIRIEESLAHSIKSAGGIFENKNLDDAVGLSLSFPEEVGGDKN